MGDEQPVIDTSVPHSARMWDFWLGGKDNYEPDRRAGEQARDAFPGIVDLAQASRAMLRRAVRFLVEEQGIRQFLDVGTGLPTAENTHQIAQRSNPEARIVYVDNDPLVLAHARALLRGTPEGRTDYLHADLHEPEEILRQAERTLDFSEPIGLILFGIVGHVLEHSTAVDIVNRLTAPLCSGSFVALYTGVDTSPALVEAERRVGEQGGVPYRLSSPDQVAELLAGLELVEPGIVPGPHWRPDGPVPDSPAVSSSLGGVARKP